MAQMNVAGQLHGTRDSLSMGAPLYSNNGPVELIPNPDFVFPMAPPIPSEPIAISGRRPRSLQPTSTTRRGSTHARGKSTNTLPDFSFNPAGDTAESSSAPSPASPLGSLPNTPTTPSHPMGHRRGGSEFIGGDGKSGLGLLSTSPTKGDGFLPPPSNVLMPGPPAGRRGHAHRRSGAISSHDLSSIMQPSHPLPRMPTAGGSAPATPMDNDMTGWPRPPINKAASQPSLHSFAMGENTSPVDDAESSPRRPPSRARVGFSDTVEYIRPLSTISSETEGSFSTIRGHSGSNSLSSVISAGAPSPPSGRRNRPTLDSTPEREYMTARPKTAGAIWDLRSERNLVFGEELKSRKRPMSALIPSAPLSPVSAGSPSPGTPKKRHFFHIPLRHTDTEMSSSSSEPTLQSVQMETPPASPMKESTDETSEEEMGKVGPSTRKSTKPRKVKSWANSIISRKPKSASRPKQSSPQATAAIPALHHDEPDMIPDFDVDNTVTIVTPTNDQISHPKMETDFASWQPKHVTPEQDARSPIIDLDLALSPFESEKRNSVGGRAQRRAMHSAGFMTGLQNHRRTESAPALVPFEARTTLGPTSVMADVFEEEEEEEERATVSPGKDSTKSVKEQSEFRAQKVFSTSVADEEAGVGIKLVDSDMNEGSTIKWNFDDGLRIHRGREELSTVLEVPQSPHSKPAQLLDPINTSVEVVEDFEEPRTSSLTRSSESTVTPSLSVHSETKESQPTMTLPVPLSGQSVRTPDTFTSSSFSSPNFSRSQSSIDTPRLGTAASSVTDNRTLNSQFGEPGPEVRVSMDVPSLTSSRSTMTNGAHPNPLLSTRNMGDRASSISSLHSGISERRNKRSSIASLSRLMGVGGSFGERSKLNIEQRPQSAHMDLKVKEAKTKKTRRLSKMMQFWRSKESLRS